LSRAFSLVPQPIRDICYSLFAIAKHVVFAVLLRLYNSSLIGIIGRRVPARMKRPLSIASLAAIVFVVFGMPMILAQGPPFYCLPFPEGDYRQRPFQTLTPFCCNGAIDDRLKTGNGCDVANGGKFITRKGQELSTCHESKQPACCVGMVGYCMILNRCEAMLLTLEVEPSRRADADTILLRSNLLISARCE
jgi:hypothetical protein